MLKSCVYCGKIHDTKYDCGKRPKNKFRKNKTTKDSFRSTKIWQLKREEIRQRDSNLCQVCIRRLYNTVDQFNYRDLSVHHAIAMEEDYSKRLDNDNLLTVCSRHHEMAENGLIPFDVIKQIIDEQEERRNEKVCRN